MHGEAAKNIQKTSILAKILNNNKIVNGTGVVTFRINNDQITGQ